MAGYRQGDGEAARRLPAREARSTVLGTSQSIVSTVLVSAVLIGLGVLALALFG